MRQLLYFDAYDDKKKRFSRHGRVALVGYMPYS